MSTYLYALLVSILFLILHSIGLYTEFNMDWPPYDIFMHIFGGIVIGIFVYALIRPRVWSTNRKRRAIMLWVLVAGILWELFEIYYGISGYTFGTNLYYVDTFKDIIDDLAGGLLIALVWCRS